MSVPLLFPVIASRGRPKELFEQERRLAAQLKPGDGIIIVLDGEIASTELVDGHKDYLTVLSLTDKKGVDRARKMGNAFVPADGVIVEIDDHDWAEPTLLDELRSAFSDPGVFIAYCDTFVSDPEHTLQRVRVKADGTFRENGMLGWGMKAYRKWVYDAVGGYPLDYFPANDLALMCMMERLLQDRGIHHIRKPLVTVIVGGGISEANKDAQAEASARACEHGAQSKFAMPFRLLWPPEASEFVLPSRNIQPEDPAVVALRAELKAKPQSILAKPHVLLVAEIAGWGRGGGEMSLLELLRLVTLKGWQATCLYARPASAQEPLANWMRFTRLKCEDPHDHGGHGLPNMKSCQRAVSECIRLLKPDILLTEARTAPIVTGIGHELNIATVALVQFWHSIMQPVEESWDALHKRPIPREWLDHEGLMKIGKADAIVANSEFTAEVIKDVTGKESAAIVYPPVNAAEAVCVGAPPVPEREFVTCPSVQRLKGVFIFLELARKNPDLKFLLLAGDNRHAHESDVLAKAEGLSNVKVHREWVLDMREIYAQTRCMFLGTQTCESFSRVSAESMANGIPMLVSDAGNLARIVDAEHGVIIPRKDPVARWNEGLQKALALRPKPDPKWCQDHSDKFASVLNAHRRLSEIAFVQCSGPGIHTAVKQMEKVLGAAIIEGVSAEAVKQHPLIIVSGQWTPELAQHCGTRLAFWWQSHMSQMDMSRHEMDALLNVLDCVSERADRFCFFSSKPEADLLGSRYGGRVRWLPNVLRMPEKPTEHPKLAGRHVFVPGPYVTRKNCYAAVSAIALAKAELHVTARAEAQAPSMLALARRLGVLTHVHTCESEEAILQVAGACGAAIMASLAETFCYAAAECIIAGTPVVGWRGIPALRRGPAQALAPDPTDIDELGIALRWAVNEPQTLLPQQFTELQELIRIHALAARHTLLETTYA